MDLFRIIHKTIMGTAEAVLFRPIRERGLIWTICAWFLALNTIALSSVLTDAGSFSVFLVWFLSLIVFMKVHSKPKRMARPIPYRRRRRR